MAMQTDEHRKQAGNFIVNQQRLKISDDQWERAELSWKFLRLNPFYQSECENLGIAQISEPLPQHNKYGLSVWINPCLRFEDIFDIAKKEVSDLGLEQINQTEAIKFMVLHYLGRDRKQAVQPIVSEFGAAFKIDLDASDSQIIKEIKDWLKKLRGKKRKERQRSTLRKCYKAIDLKLVNKKKREEIADIMFPVADSTSEQDLYKMTSDQEVEDKRDNTDAIMRKIDRYLETGNYLVNGGYRDI
jgi:hypothetical protein